MQFNPNSRRGFLSSMAILATGAAFGSAIDLFSAQKNPTDLQQQWKFFWRRNGGRQRYEQLPLPNNFLPEPCKGHVHKTGRAVYFSNENMLAQPTWIHWKEGGIPADVIVTFYTNEERPKKLFRINRFELEGMNALLADTKEDSITLLKEMLKTASLEKTNRNLTVSTRIKKRQNVQILTTFVDKKITIEKNLIYHT